MIASDAFSARTRSANLSRLAREQYDILIIGGGITGAGIARDAAMRGYRTALIDKGDFASGTSSKSSKLVHAGVRYLEQFEFGLVFEASRERRILGRIAPDLVTPLPFLFPIYRDGPWPAWMIDVGMWMYDGLALFRNFGRHRMFSNQRIQELMPGIDARNISKGAYYFDGQVNDARLTLESVRDAHRHGATIANYVEVDALTKENGRVVGVEAHDVKSGERFAFRAQVVVNATGPWTDKLLQLDDPHSPKRLRPTKGVHVFVPRFKIGGESAVAFPSFSDGRLMFVIPWGDFTIIGTTDTDYDGDFDNVYADAGDVDYIIAAVNHAFPKSPIERSDIVSTYAGLRPLVSQLGKGTSGTSREHVIWTSESGLLTIAGGKLTTYRSMAQELVDLAAKRLADIGIPQRRPSLTAETPLIPSDGAVPAVGLGERIIGHLKHSYGPEYARVVEVANRDPRLARPIVEGLPYIWAQVHYAIEQEMAMTVSDVLGRRTHILYEAPDNGASAARQVARMLSEFLDWDQPRIEREVKGYEDEIRRICAFRES